MAVAVWVGGYMSESGASTALRDNQGNDISPVTDWRSTMMANAVRDPFWQAQVESEVVDLPQLKTVIEDTCNRCHAPMGRTQAIHDGAASYSLDQARADIAQVYLARSPVFGLGLGHRAVIHSEDLIIDDPQALQGDHASGILTDSGRGTLARLRIRTSGDGINLRATTGAMNATISDALVSGKATPNESDYRRSGLECFGADARCRIRRSRVLPHGPPTRR